MIIPLRVWPAAWLPLTPRGVAAFAGARLSRLLLVQFVFALATAIVVIWFLSTCWFPAIRSAIQQLPSRGAIQSGNLDWKGGPARLLADGRFIAFDVDPDHGSRIVSSADIQVEFGRQTVRIISLFGYGEWAYPDNLNVAFNRSELQPWWGAWEPPVLWIGMGIVVAALMAGWAFLATFSLYPVWLLGFFANRNLDRRASWKLAGAALMPGSLLTMVGIVLYGLGVFDLVKLLALNGANFLVGGAFLLISPFFTIKLASPDLTQRNPFVTGREDGARNRL